MILLYKLFNTALPRVRDFRGDVSYTLLMEEETTQWVLKEQLIFPEIEYDKIDKIRGMDMAIFVTTAKKMMKKLKSYYFHY